MKRINIVLSLLLIITLFGCKLNNTPTSKVEELLSKYQKCQTEYIEKGIDMITYNEDIKDDDLKKYRKIVKKQYQNMTYNIKDEEIDGNTSKIKVEIEVLDYKKILDKLDIEDKEYQKSKIENLSNVKDKITYTIEIELYKQNDIWKIKELSSIDNEKLLGIY